MSLNQSYEPVFVPDIIDFTPIEVLDPLVDPKCVIPFISTFCKLWQLRNISDKICVPAEQDNTEPSRLENDTLADESEVQF